MGACLSKFKEKTKRIEILYKAWCLSIINREPDNAWLNNPDVQDISRAIALQRKGLRFFTMRVPFFFDCFNLLSVVYSDKSDCLFQWLRKEYCGVFSRSVLKKVYDFFQHGSNVEMLPPELLEHKKLCEEYIYKKEKRILVVANVSAGKSTLINALVGYRLNRTKTTACTNRLCYIYNKPVDDGVLSYSHINDEYYYSNVIESVSSDFANKISLKFNSTFGDEKICFIDTPGINNVNNSEHRKITETIIKADSYDVVIYVSNSKYFGTTDEHSFLEYLKKYVRKPIIFVLNQLDDFVPEEDSISKMLDDYKSDLIKFGFNNPTVVPVSAYASYLFRTETSLLTKIEIRKLEMLNEVFENDYYDLPVYINEQSSKDKLSMTGIISLENKIITI